MEENDEIYLGLRLGLSDYRLKRDYNPKKNNKHVFFLDLSIPHHPVVNGNSNDSSSIPKISFGDDEKLGIENSFSNCIKEEDNTIFPKNGSRKMLKLTRDQTTLLEGTFKQHSTLNTAQKQALAAKLNLKPRQVQVWFQNRRARTKLKQTEVACELLKKNYERLSQENQRLKKELLMLRSSILVKTEKTPPSALPFFCHIPTATANKTCLSCEKYERQRGGGCSRYGNLMINKNGFKGNLGFVGVRKKNEVIES